MDVEMQDSTDTPSIHTSRYAERLKAWLKTTSAHVLHRHFRTVKQTPADKRFDDDPRGFAFSLPEELKMGELRSPAELWKLFDENDLEGFLIKGWETRPASPPRYLPEYEHELGEQLYAGFLQHYRGKGVDRLKQTIDGYFKTYHPGQNYGKIVVYAQSSGTGKTRTIVMLSEEGLALLVCLRGIRETLSDEPEALKGWPPGDQPVCAFFKKPTEDGFNYKGEEIASAFMASLFTEMAGVLVKSSNIAKFNEHMKFSKIASPDSSRYQFFQGVRKGARALLMSHSAKLIERRRIPGSIDPNTQHAMGTSEWVDELYKLLVEGPGQRLEQQAMQAFKQDRKDQKYIVIALDECTELNPVNPDKPTDGLSLLAMQRVMKACEGLKIWFILADTNAGLHETVPVTGDQAPSRRLKKSMTMLNPHYYVQWDVMLQSFPRPTTPRKALSLQWLARYGRPYWSTLLDRQLSDAAVEKLTCNAPFDPSNLHHVLAVFSNRALLEISSNSTTKNLALQAVRSHMRVFTGLQYSDIAGSFVPSEPMLAIAATEILLNEDKQHYQAAVSTLVKQILLKKDLLEKGLQGELFARLLLTLARDAALASSTGLDLSNWTVATVSLSSFLQSLLGHFDHRDGRQPPPGWQDIMNCTQGYQLNFTHFYQLSDSITCLSPAFLFKCWQRGIALTCSFGQPNFDILLVGYRGDKLDDDFDHSALFLVSIQIKARFDAALLNLINTLTCPIVTCSGEDGKPQHLVMLMDLGTSSKFAETSSHILCGYGRAVRPGHKSHTLSDDQQQSSYASNPRKHSRQWAGYLSVERERHWISVRGNGRETYPVIGELGPDLTACWQSSTKRGPEDSSLEMKESFDELRGCYTEGEDI